MKQLCKVVLILDKLFLKYEGGSNWPPSRKIPSKSPALLGLNGRKNIFVLGNVITLQIILRNEIPGNNNLFKVTST